MAINDDRILDAARAIRPYLPRLVGPRADDVERDLAQLLNRASGGEVVDHEILAYLERDPATHEWTAAFLERGHPSDVAIMREKGLQELPGHGEVVAAARYSCPGGDYLWYRRTVGQEVPRCPTHQLLLEPARVT
jgi:hypothetical protein